MRRTLALTLVALSLLLPTVGPLTGCQGGGFGAFDPRAAAMAALSEAMKQNVKSYLAGMEGLVRELSSVKDLSSAMASVEKVKPYYDDVQRVAPELKKITGKDLENLRIAFGPEIEKVAADFNVQAERITGSGSIGTILRSVIDRVHPFSIK